MLVVATLSSLMYSCTKEQSEKLEHGGNENALTSYDNYVVYESHQAFENHINYYISLSAEAKNEFKDSLISQGIMPLNTTLNDTDETWMGLESLTAILNKDKLVQIGDSLIKIDKEANVAYILSPVELDYLPDLKNNQVVDGYVHLHDNLEQPIFEEYEDEAYGKGGLLFCRSRWAREKERLTYSWDNQWRVYMAPVGTSGVKWKIKYTAAGAYFAIVVKGTPIHRLSNGNISVQGNRSMFHHATELSRTPRCRANGGFTNYTEVGVGDAVYIARPYEGIRALSDYNYKFWGRHTHQSAFFNAYDWPLEIEDN